jgi:hypothetical protein
MAIAKVDLGLPQLIIVLFANFVTSEPTADLRRRNAQKSGRLTRGIQANADKTGWGHSGRSLSIGLILSKKHALYKVGVKDG